MSSPGAIFLSESLQRRDDCVLCPPGVVPSCPLTCPTGQLCSVVTQSCSSCAFSTCLADPNYVPKGQTTSSSSSSPNVGAIAGGVIGGVVALAVLVYLVWRFCVKNKRQFEAPDWVEFNDGQTPAEKEFARRRDARTSTHTVASIASTVLTRASNIIQIAYIPGVTNRSSPSTPNLIPPVPPIPIALAGSPETPYEDQHFFMPGDLRGSTYSGMTDRTSYAPRSSVASTIYGKNAVISPFPAQTVIRGKAAVVSVKSNGGHSPGDMTPPVPYVDYDKYKIGPSSPAFSVGSTFLNSTVSQNRPSIIRDSSALELKGPRLSGEDEASRGVMGRESAAITFIDDTPLMDQGPFSDPPPRASGHTKNGSLSAVIEEATKRAHGDVRAGLGLKRESNKTPFGDEHKTEN